MARVRFVGAILILIMCLHLLGEEKSKVEQKANSPENIREKQGIEEDNEAAPPQDQQRQDSAKVQRNRQYGYRLTEVIGRSGGGGSVGGSKSGRAGGGAGGGYGSGFGTGRGYGQARTFRFESGTDGSFERSFGQTHEDQLREMDTLISSEKRRFELLRKKLGFIRDAAESENAARTMQMIDSFIDEENEKLQQKLSTFEKARERIARRMERSQERRAAAQERSRSMRGSRNR